jgi:ATPase subunit of ABC transporter with duplicated ATPase domains
MEPFVLRIPTTDSQVELVVGAGEVVYVLGANGTGKSGLMSMLAASNRGRTRRILAHRMNWMESNSINFSPADRRVYQKRVAQSDAQMESRHLDRQASSRPSLAMADLLDAENTLARQSRDALRSNDLKRARSLAEEKSPLEKLNEIMRLSDIPIAISIANDEQVLASKNGGATYPGFRTPPPA